MPDDYRTQGPSNDAPRDPLDDLIAPILGHNVTPEPRNVPTRPETSKQGPRNPLDDLITDAELRTEASKAATRFAAKDQARWHFLRSTPGRVFAILTIVLIAIGALIGEQFGGRLAWKGWSERWFAEGKRQVDPEAKLPTTEGKSIALVPAKILTPKELFASASPAIVRVNVYNARSKPIGHGSGFFVRDDSTVVTNFHVIDGANSAEVVLKDGTQLAVRGVEAADEASDIAILKVDHGTKNVVRYLTLGSNELPPVGGRVYVIGSPKGYDYTLSDGIVSGHHERDGRKWIQTTAPISHGSSGSPVLSDDGAVLGVATWVDWGGQNLNFASPAAAIATLLARNSPLQELSELVGAKKRRLAEIRVIAENRSDESTESASRLMNELPDSYQRFSDYWRLRGDIAFFRLKSEAAIAAYFKAVMIDDLESQVWHRIGLSYFTLARFMNPDKEAARIQYAEAVKAYQHGVTLNSQDAQCWSGLGESLRELKRQTDAKVAFQQSISINPNQAATHANLGEVLAELGDVDGGIAEYKIALSIDAEAGDYFSATRHFGYGGFLQQNGRYQEAIAAYEKGLKLSAESPFLEEYRKMVEKELPTVRRLMRVPAVK